MARLFLGRAFFVWLSSEEYYVVVELELYIDDAMQAVESEGIEERASLLSDWAVEHQVGEVAEVSASWMNREDQEVISFSRVLRPHDLLFRNRMVVWDDKNGEVEGLYREKNDGEEAALDEDLHQAHASAYREKDSVSLHLRDETFSPSRSVEFIKLFLEHVGADWYGFDVEKYSRFDFYRAQYEPV